MTPLLRLRERLAAGCDTATGSRLLASRIPRALTPSRLAQILAYIEAAREQAA